MTPNYVLMNRSELGRALMAITKGEGIPPHIRVHKIAWTPAKIAGRWIWGKRYTRFYDLGTNGKYKSVEAKMGWV